MVITLADWQFRVDVDATISHTGHNATDHCECDYCRNYYEAVDASYPDLRPFLAKFGVLLEGPSELMPFEPTLVMACYRVQGEIISRGYSNLYLGEIRIQPEEADEDSFFLWVGEIELPWLQKTAMEDVISPANEPEFMERMLEKWLRTREDEELN